MNQAWVGGGLPFPNSAVPVLPNVPAGSPAPAAVPPGRTTLAMNDCSVDATAGERGATVGPGRRAGCVIRFGACQRPAATVAATDAICTGLASTRPCPMAEAATSVWSTGLG